MTTENDYPEHWSSSAIDTVETVLESRPDLAGPEFSALCQAAELISNADHLDEVARADNYVAHSLKSGPVRHPALAEARLARSAAATILGRLANSRSAVNRGNIQKRWKSRPSAGAR
jgi:hypothetical protein